MRRDELLANYQNSKTQPHQNRTHLSASNSNSDTPSILITYITIYICVNQE